MKSNIGSRTELRILRPDEIPHVLKPGELGVALEWAVTDPKTGKVSQHVVRKSESFVRQFFDLLYGQMRLANSVSTASVRDTSNTLRNVLMMQAIAHGAGAGAMMYDAVTFGTPGSDATTSQLTITRNFTANVGGITVFEIGVYCRAYDGAARYFMIIRDVIGGGIPVPAGQVLTVNYRPQATV
jgi:hypothetical protein